MQVCKDFKFKIHDSFIELFINDKTVIVSMFTLKYKYCKTTFLFEYDNNFYYISNYEFLYKISEKNYNLILDDYFENMDTPLNNGYDY